MASRLTASFSADLVFQRTFAMEALERATSGQTIRVFVSSTFRDMHAERDALNRLVFPEVRRRCQARGAEFVGLDLRWGVTEDEIQREGTLAICLQEIAQCRPFFVCLLGERFGSVYPPDEVPVSFWDRVPREPALRPLVEEWYRRDETATPPVYRLRREATRPLPNEEATALVQYWEAQGLPGAGDSLTAHEMFRGVLEAAEPPAHALCYVRSPGLTDAPGFPPRFVPVFVETDEARRQKLAALRTRVRSAVDRLTVHDYDAGYAGLTIDASLLPPDLSPTDRAALDDGVVTPEEWRGVSPQLGAALEQHGTVALTGMDAFAARVTEDLWRVMEPQLARPVRLDAHQRERAYHDRFVSRHAAFFQGRGPERERIRLYLDTPDDRDILVVTGEAGVGKSAFLAACVRDARTRRPETLVIPHFIGTAPDSASLMASLRSLCETLRRETPLEDAVADEPDKLRIQLRGFLEQAGTRRPVILIIDALNQLDPSGRSHELNWLPLCAPPGTRIVVSALPGDCLDQLTRRVPADHIVTILPLPENERRMLITSVLARRRKQLTPHQLTALLDTRTRPDAALPLYTLVALEELCLFGEYGTLNARLASLPPTLPELFAQVLARLEQDHTRPTVEEVCAWLAVARAGLLEAEVLDLLSHSNPFPHLRWTRLYRALEAYLKPIDEEAADSATGRLDFYHDQLRSAVFDRYLQMATPDAAPTDAFRSTHRRLADYFRAVAYDETLANKWRTDRVRSFSELPFHQTGAEMWETLYRTLTDFGFLEAKCTCAAVITVESGGDARKTYGGVYELQDDFRRALERFPTTRRGLESFYLAVQHEATKLARMPQLTRAQLWNALRWSDAARDALARIREDERPILQSAWPVYSADRGSVPVISPGRGSVSCVDVASNGALAAFGVHDRPVCMPRDPGRVVVIQGPVWRPVYEWQPFGPEATGPDVTGPVSQVAFSPACDRLAVGSGDGQVAVYEITGRLVFRATHPQRLPIVALCWSPAGDRILVARTFTGHWSTRGWLTCIDCVTGTTSWELDEHTLVSAVHAKGLVWSSRHGIVGCAGLDVVRLDPDSGARVGDSTPCGGARVALNNNESLLAFTNSIPPGGVGNLHLLLWDLERWTGVGEIPGRKGFGIQAFCFSSNSSEVAISWPDRHVAIWDVSSPANPRQVQAVDGAGDPVAWIKGHNRPFCKGWNSIYLIGSGKEASAEPRHAGDVSCVDISHDGRFVASGSWLDKTICVWSVASGENVARHRVVRAAHHAEVNDVRWSPDGTRLAVTTRSGGFIYHLTDGRLGDRLAGGEMDLETLVWSPSGRYLFAGGFQGYVAVYDILTGLSVEVLERETLDRERVQAIAWSASGRYAAIGGRDRVVRVLEIGLEEPPTCRLVAAFNMPGWVECIDWFADEHALLVSVGAARLTGLVCAWDLRRAGMIWTIEESSTVRACRVLTDQRHIGYVTAEGSLVLSAPEGGSRVMYRADSPMNALARAPIGERLACGCGDGQVMLWDVASRLFHQTLGDLSSA
jgi:WD40 repeat protein